MTDYKIKEWLKPFEELLRCYGKTVIPVIH